MKREDIKIGDKVVIARIVEEEAGWSNTWVRRLMDRYAGGTYTVSNITSMGVRFEEIGFGWPWGALELIEKYDPLSRVCEKVKQMKANRLALGYKF